MIILYIILAIVAIYLLGYVITVAIMFFKPDHKFGRWWTENHGFNWTKLQISLVFSILWFVLLLPERKYHD